MTISQVILLACLYFFSTSCQVLNYTNNYLIPENYRGWLVVRHSPKAQRRPLVVTHDFNPDGFCINKYRCNKWYTPHYFIKGQNGLIPVQGMQLHSETRSDEIYVWSFGTHGPANRPAYKGESWEILFVGRMKEYLAARRSHRDFIKSHHLNDKTEPQALGTPTLCWPGPVKNHPDFTGWTYGAKRIYLPKRSTP
jgi:hypothetical protein